MKIAIRDFGSIGNTVNGYGGGEQRWSANLAHFLAAEGHDLIRCAEGQDHNCDLFLDASWERCQNIKAPVHVHFSFFACNAGGLEFPCLPSGDCNMAVPYRNEWIKNVEWNKKLEKSFTNLFIPQPYPDAFLPAAANAVEGFARTEIMWASKDMFHPNFVSTPRSAELEHVFVQGGLDMLRALLRLQEKAEFKMNFLMSHFLDQAHPRLGVPELLSRFRNVEFQGQLPWTDLLEVAAKCKLSVPVGGLWGSIPEAVFTKGLPMYCQRNLFSAYFGCRLPTAELTDEDDMYEALEDLWFDEKVYQRDFEIQQILFEDHRTEGLRRNLKIAFEQLGL